MAKAGMRRPDPKEPHGTESNHKMNFPKNTIPPVPQIQGKAKAGKEKARPLMETSAEHPTKVFHELKGDGSVGNTELH